MKVVVYHKQLSLSSAFLCKRVFKKKPIICFRGADLSSPKTFGRKTLKELNAVTKEKFGKPIQEVLTETPRSHICKKPTSNERKIERKRLEKEIRDDIQKEMDQNGASIVMENRTSWNVFNKIRKKEGLASTPKRKRQDNDDSLPSTKRKCHGCKSENLAINKEELLRKARMWTPEEDVNWSQLAAKYGLITSNRGQVIKEFLKGENIPATFAVQRPTNTPRRPKKKFKRGTALPMHKPIAYQKQRIKEKMQRGELTVGQEVVTSEYSRYRLDSTSNIIVEEKDRICARKIPFLEIRQKLLKKHEELGIIRGQPDVYFDTMPIEEVKHQLQKLSEPIDSSHTELALRERLKQTSRQCFFKVWHDHSTIAGHGHFLVLVSCIYDPAFYYTPDEMKALKGIDIDVPTLVENPEVHILGRSTSSLDNQAEFNTTQKQCLKDLSVCLKTTSGVPIHDVCRFFHGDAPAAQFEAGHNIGGKYSCPGCGAESCRFDDFAYCFRCPIYF